MLTRTVLVAALLAVGANPTYWDPVIAGVTLEDARSGEAFVRRHALETIEPEDDFPRVSLLNSDGTEVLELLQHYGAERYAFGQFRVRRLSAHDAGRGTKDAPASFLSGKGVRLGLAVEELLDRLGARAQRTRDGQQTTLRYSCSSTQACPGLIRVNMPSYEATYTFQNGKLVSFEAGYPYP
jgi:hypothetical protein